MSYDYDRRNPVRDPSRRSFLGSLGGLAAWPLLRMGRVRLASRPPLASAVAARALARRPLRPAVAAKVDITDDAALERALRATGDAVHPYAGNVSTNRYLWRGEVVDLGGLGLRSSALHLHGDHTAA